MKKLLKSTLSVLLCAVLVFGAVAVGGAGIGGLSGTVSAKAETTYKAGDIIEYGSYPQSKVNDETTLAALNALDKSWISYKYYSGTGARDDGKMIPSDYMKYADVYYGGEKYRAVTFSAYRPILTGYTSSADRSYQDDNGYSTGTEETPNIFWFKFEPLKWRVLDPAKGLVLSESIIDSQVYNNYKIKNAADNEYYGDSEYKHFASDYANSSLRQWLNDDFYNTAFGSTEKSNIATTTLNNDGYFTLTGKTGYEKLDSDSTDDKIFLLSYTDANSLFTDNSSRVATGTDYAKCQGLHTSGSNGTGNSHWRFRSPGGDSYKTCYVTDGGGFTSSALTDNTFLGVRLALNMLNLKSYTLSYDLNGTTSTAPAAITANYGTTVMITDEKPVREGCTFLGWAKESGAAVATYTAGSKIEITADTTLYAVWQTNDHLLTYDANGGSGAPAAQSGLTITVSGTVPTRSGYSFLGWSQQSTATAATYKVGNTIKLSADMTLYAVWSLDEVPIEPDKPISAVLNAPSGKTVDYKTTVTINVSASNVPAGYSVAIFDGGYKLASGDYSATYTTDKLTYSKTYTARIIRNGTNSVAKDLSWHKLEKEIDINVKTDFFSRIVAFFRGLFNKLPSVTIG